MNGGRTGAGRARSAALIATAAVAYVLTLVPIACMPAAGPLEDDALDALTLMAAGADTDTAALATPPGSHHQVTPVNAFGIPVILTGQLDHEHDYQLYACGPGDAGDRWIVEHPLLWPGDRVVVALFDENMCLLARSGNPASRPLVHVLRRDSPRIFVGVTPGCEQPGRSYLLQVRRSAGAAIPRPRPQVAWLNFAGTSNLSVGSYRHLAFGPFSGALITDAYAADTDEIKTAIAQTVLHNYAAYDLAVLSSDETPVPPADCSIIHFGGISDAQLGVADNVDGYNADLSQNAVVFARSFAPYETMHLTPAQMGQMIGNVASHELGHLLGLYHVAEANNLMAEAEVCTAWDLAEEQHFQAADLYPCVFPTGRLNAARLLEDTLGPRSEPLPLDIRAPAD